MTNRTTWTLLSGLVGLFVSAPAMASPTFPEAVQDAAGLPCTPQCILCHQTNDGGFGTATRSFAVGLKGENLDEPVPFENTLEFGNPDTVAPAIQYAEDNGLDFDGDGTPDIVELKGGMYPSTDEDFCEGPMYGCGARVSPRGNLDGLAAAFAALVALGLLRLGKRR